MVCGKKEEEGFVAVLGFDMLFVPLWSVDLLNWWNLLGQNVN
jgi:hypothetical protein